MYGQGPTVRHEDQAYVPISALNPYQNKWIIKGRCVATRVCLRLPRAPADMRSQGDGQEQDPHVAERSRGGEALLHDHRGRGGALVVPAFLRMPHLPSRPMHALANGQPQGTDMRATFFRDAVDRFFDAITVGRVYSISRGRLKPTSGKFGNTASSYELTLGADAEITCVCSPLPWAPAVSLSRRIPQ